MVAVRVSWCICNLFFQTGHPPLYCAVFKGHVCVAEMLMDGGGDRGFVNPKVGV